MMTEPQVKIRRIRNMEGLQERKQAKAKLDGFLQYLISAPTKQEKIAMITKANPYHFILFNEGNPNE